MHHAILFCSGSAHRFFSYPSMQSAAMCNVCAVSLWGEDFSFQFALSLNFGHFFFSNLFFFCERALSFRLLKMNFFFFFSEIKLLALPSGGNAQTTAISKANCCIWECWCAADGNGNFVSALQLRSAATYYYCLAFLFLFFLLLSILCSHCGRTRWQQQTGRPKQTVKLDYLFKQLVVLFLLFLFSTCSVVSRSVTAVFGDCVLSATEKKDRAAQPLFPLLPG